MNSSPNVFVQNSTPKTDQKFKWTIEDISSLKPADIDETTVSQHVCTTDDPLIQSLVQQKIHTFFSEEEIAPSPMNVKDTTNVPLLKDCSILEDTPHKAPVVKETCEGIYIIIDSFWIIFLCLTQSYMGGWGRYC